MLHFAAAISIFVLCSAANLREVLAIALFARIVGDQSEHTMWQSVLSKIIACKLLGNGFRGANGAVHSRTWWFRNGADEIYDTSAWKRDMDWRWRKIHLSQAGVANGSIVAARAVRHRPVKPSNQFKTRNNGEMVAGVSDSLCSEGFSFRAAMCVYRSKADTSTIST